MSRGGCLLTTSEHPNARWSGEGVGFPMGNWSRGPKTKQGVRVGQEEPVNPVADMPTWTRVSFYHDARRPIHETQRFLNLLGIQNMLIINGKSKVVHR